MITKNINRHLINKNDSGDSDDELGIADVHNIHKAMDSKLMGSVISDN